MSKHGAAAILAALFPVVALTNCAVTLSPVEAESTVVTPVTDASHSLILNEPMVFLDQQPPNRGIRFREGTYTLEGEDAQYLYYRAPSQIEYRVFKNGAVVDFRFLSGGIYISKSLNILNPAGAYFTQDETHKLLMWKLGGEFIHLEGSKWVQK